MKSIHETAVQVLTVGAPLRVALGSKMHVAILNAAVDVDVIESRLASNARQLAERLAKFAANVDEGDVRAPSLGLVEDLHADHARYDATRAHLVSLLSLVDGLPAYRAEVARLRAEAWLPTYHAEVARLRAEATK